MNPCVRPARFPVIQVGLSFLQTFEAHPFQRCLLGMSNARFDLALSIWIGHSTRKCDRTTMLQHVTVERIQSGIVDIGSEHAFAQVVEYDHTRHAVSRRKAFSCSSAQIWELERNTSKRTDFRL